MTFNAPIEQAFAAVRGIIYYSTTMFNNFVYLNASDQGNSGMGGIRTATKTLSITCIQVRAVAERLSRAWPVICK
jgi:hypothetical protein